MKEKQTQCHWHECREIRRPTAEGDLTQPFEEIRVAQANNRPGPGTVAAAAGARCTPPSFKKRATAAQGIGMAAKGGATPTGASPSRGRRGVREGTEDSRLARWDGIGDR